MCGHRCGRAECNGETVQGRVRGRHAGQESQPAGRSTTACADSDSGRRGTQAGTDKPVVLMDHSRTGV